jgi:hypothetical protein
LLHGNHCNKKISTAQEPALILAITAIVHRKLMEELIISDVFDASCRQYKVVNHR